MSRLQFRIFKAHSVAKGPLVTAVKRVIPTSATPGDLAAALRDAQRPTTDAERKATLADRLRPTEVQR
jgi:hypothetical protein